MIGIAVTAERAARGWCLSKPLVSSWEQKQLLQHMLSTPSRIYSIFVCMSPVESLVTQKCTLNKSLKIIDFNLLINFTVCAVRAQASTAFHAVTLYRSERVCRR